MSPSELLDLAAELVLIASAGVYVHRSLHLRNALIDRPYRTRALWTAIGALSVVALISAVYLDTLFGQQATTVEGLLVEDVAWGFAFVAIYGWVVSNINVAIAADFFNRDSFRWKKGGSIMTIVVVVVSYFVFSLPPWWFPGALGYSTAVVVFEILLAAVSIYATIVLALTYFRIQDKTIRNYTKWVVLCIGFEFSFIYVPSGFLVLPAIGWVYSIYRSVGSLAIRTRSLAA